MNVRMLEVYKADLKVQHIFTNIPHYANTEVNPQVNPPGKVPLVIYPLVSGSTIVHHV